MSKKTPDVDGNPLPVLSSPRRPKLRLIEEIGINQYIKTRDELDLMRRLKSNMKELGKEQIILKKATVQVRRDKLLTQRKLEECLFDQELQCRRGQTLSTERM